MDAPRSMQAPSAAVLICVVDDDALLREGLTSLLRSAGYATVAFDSAEACLASHRRDQCAFAILDVELGGMNGMDLQRRLLAGPPLPLLFLSGHGDSRMQRLAQDAGAIAFLRKPVDTEQLLAIIGGVVGVPERQTNCLDHCDNLPTGPARGG